MDVSDECKNIKKRKHHRDTHLHVSVSRNLVISWLTLDIGTIEAFQLGLRPSSNLYSVMLKVYTMDNPRTLYMVEHSCPCQVQLSTYVSFYAHMYMHSRYPTGEYTCRRTVRD